MRHFYVPFLLLLLFAASAQAQENDPLFPHLEQALYQDAAHAYDDPTVIMLSKRHTPLLQSRLIPVRQGETVSFETYVHYTKSKAKTWQKVGAAAAGLAIGSLPYVLDRGQSVEGASNRDWLKTAAPLAGAGVAALPFVLDKHRGKPIRRSLSAPRVKNGLFVPNAYLRYKLYDAKGHLLKTETQSIDKQAKGAWQRLALRQEVIQDGFVQIELGNTSRRSVWVDGFTISTSNNVIRKDKGLSTALEQARSATDSLSNEPDSVTNNSGVGAVDLPMTNTQPIAGDPEDGDDDDDDGSGTSGGNGWEIKGGDGTQDNVDRWAISESSVGADYGATYTYGFGLNGSKLNLLTIRIPANGNYDNLLESVIEP